jgi:putative ABC transport system substrate-binding protein
MAIRFDRRKFIALLGCGAFTRPAGVVHAQNSRTPVIGYLGAESPVVFASRLAAFREGLREGGYVEGRNVTIEFRWAESQHSRLAALAAELVDLHVDVIAAPGGVPAALAAKSKTQTIPIIFEMGADPVAQGVVASLNRPGGNLTGVTSLNVGLAQKRLELLRELLPKATVFAVLVNPSSPTTAPQLKNLEEAALAQGLQLRVLQASTLQDLDAVFGSLPKLNASGLVVASDTFLGTHGGQVAALAAQHAMPTIHQSRDFAAAGGLMSYGGDFLESNRLAGVYVARIIKGENPADLPVQQVTKFDMAINRRAAKALGLTISARMLIRANYVIE